MLPVRNPKLGELSGIFNSINPTGAPAATENWLSIVNLDKSSLDGLIDVFDTDGKHLLTLSFGPIAPGARQDFPLGHPGQISGLYRV